MRPRREWKYRVKSLKYRGDICENCGSGNYLCAHHKNGDYTDNSINNIQTLCNSCHLKLHWAAGLYNPPPKHSKGGRKSAFADVLKGDPDLLEIFCKVICEDMWNPTARI